MLNILMGIFFIHYINDEIAFSFEISNIFNEEIKFKRSCDVLRDEYMIEILNLLGVKNKKKPGVVIFNAILIDEFNGSKEKIMRLSKIESEKSHQLTFHRRAWTAW